MPKITSIIIEGLDRTGKDTLIDNIMHELGVFQRLHYEKPMKLQLYTSVGYENPEQLYQEDSFKTMFDILGSGARVILNRAHLGEYVYAPRYRGYSGDYVFYQEANAYKQGKLDNTALILLTADTSVLVDDGKSFDYSKRAEEQEDFIKAFERSCIPIKLQVPVTKQGAYRTPHNICKNVLDFIWAIERQ
jgi:hypothetical protein